MIIENKIESDSFEKRKKELNEKIENKNNQKVYTKKSKFYESFIRIRHLIYNTLFSRNFYRAKIDVWISFGYVTVIAILSFLCVIPLLSSKTSHLRIEFINYYYFLVVLFFLDWLFRLSFIDIHVKKSNKKLFSIILYEFSILPLIDFFSFMIPIVLLIINNNNTNILIVPIILVLKSITAFRLLYIFNKNESIKIFLAIIKKSFKQLLFVFLAMLFFVFLFSVLLYNIEIDDSSSKIKNWFDSFWMSFITITTIGYGDVYPVTSIGRILTMLLAILGIGFYSFLTSIIVNSFTKYLDELRRKRELHNLENSKKILEKYKDEIDNKINEINETNLSLKNNNQKEFTPLNKQNKKIKEKDNNFHNNFLSFKSTLKSKKSKDKK